jgi:glucuronokinase
VGGHPERLSGLMNANFDLRDRIFKVAEANRRMVHTARSTGCSAKFAGSGGAIVGTYEDEAQYQRLVTTMATIGCATLKPRIKLPSQL